MNADEFNAAWGADAPPIEPPEVRVALAAYPVVEFFCDLGADRPDADLFDLVASFLRSSEERALLAFTISYATPEGADGPVLRGDLFLGDVIDFDGGDQ